MTKDLYKHLYKHTTCYNKKYESTQNLQRLGNRHKSTCVDEET